MNKLELKKYIKDKILTKNLKVKSVAIRWGYLDKIKDDLNKYIGDGQLQEKLYLFYFNKQKPICKKCGKPLKFSNFSRPYNTWCSNKCSSSDKEILKQSKTKRMNKYGNYNNYEKIKETNLKKYGVENVSQIEDIKEKKKQTTLNNFGVKYPMQSKVVRKKLRKNNIEKYGVDNVSQLEEIKDKKKQTMLNN